MLDLQPCIDMVHSAVETSKWNENIKHKNNTISCENVPLDALYVCRPVVIHRAEPNGHVCCLCAEEVYSAAD